jgi:hypothetical protein
LIWKARSADGTIAAVEVAGLDPIVLAALSAPGMTPDRWTSFLAVRVVALLPARTSQNPPVWGKYHAQAGVIRFEPRFPLVPGMRYRADFDPERLDALARELSPGPGLAERNAPFASKLAAEYSPPQKRARPTTKVTEVYPTRATLPENLLRFYIAFSAPMSRGEAYGHVKLESASGKPVDSPFLELEQELWTGDGTRFTLLLDPGRIKRGLRPREEIGPILEEGKRYSLVIDPGWPDAEGNPLAGGFRKSFQVSGADETAPEPKAWDLSRPRAATRDPLELRFPEPLDRALLDRLIVAQDRAGKAVPGQVSIAGEETIWRLTPRYPWRSGVYRLVVGADLEDVAGNSVARPFEVDLAGPISRRVASEQVVLPLRIGPPQLKRSP